MLGMGKLLICISGKSGRLGKAKGINLGLGLLLILGISPKVMGIVISWLELEVFLDELIFTTVPSSKVLVSCEDSEVVSTLGSPWVTINQPKSENSHKCHQVALYDLGQCGNKLGKFITGQKWAKVGKSGQCSLLSFEHLL